MKILYVLPYAPSTSSNGGSGRMYNVIKGMYDRGHSVSVLAYCSTDEEMEKKQEITPFCERVTFLKRRPTYSISNFKIRGLLDNEFHSDDMYETHLRMLDVNEFDIVHYKYYQMAPYMIQSKTHVNVFSDYENPFLTVMRGKSSLFHKWTQTQELMRRTSILSKISDMFISLTDVDADDIRKRIVIPNHTVHNTGVDMTYFSQDNVKLKNRNRSLVFVGYFQHPPNCDAMQFFVKEIFPSLIKEYPDLVLNIVGKDPPLEIRSYESKNIHVTGFVDDIRPYMHNNAIYVVPIRQGAGIRGKILEAWSMGLPVVTTKRASEGIRVVDKENCLIANTPDEFIQATLSLLSDPKLSRSISQKGHETATQMYSWKAKLDELNALYMELMKKKRKKYD